jgi:hypothetical protein
VGAQVTNELLAVATRGAATRGTAARGSAVRREREAAVRRKDMLAMSEVGWVRRREEGRKGAVVVGKKEERAKSRGLKRAVRAVASSARGVSCLAGRRWRESCARRPLRTDRGARQQGCGAPPSPLSQRHRLRTRCKALCGHAPFLCHFAPCRLGAAKGAAAGASLVRTPQPLLSAVSFRAALRLHAGAGTSSAS